MRILMLSKALVVGQYRSKARLLAAKPHLELTIAAPPSWQDERGCIRLEEAPAEGYRIMLAPIRFNGHFHIHYYPKIGKILSQVQPDIIHLDEEPYNLATFHALLQAHRAAPKARFLFFTWQNLNRAYPPPFRWMEQYVYHHAHAAIAGNRAAVEVLRAKGFTKPISTIPQFGVDPVVYAPAESRRRVRDRFVIGMAARLVPEKGAALLLEAAAQLPAPWELRIVGSGPEREKLKRRTRELQCEHQVIFLPWQSSANMPDFYRQLDVLVAPSVSRPNWTEQFGRVLIEAMACGVPVVGSSSGEIPNVIGDAGIVFAEGQVGELVRALFGLMEQPARRAELAAKGRQRVLCRFTQERIADETFALYTQLAH